MVYLNKMEASGEVDMSILEVIDNLREFLATLKSKWLDAPNTDAFYFYLAIRCTEMILDKMDRRFRNAARLGDNPKVAKDSLAVLAPIRDLLAAASARSISESSINDVLDCTQRLHMAVDDVDLQESIEASWALIDMDLLKSQRFELLKNIRQVRMQDTVIIPDTYKFTVPLFENYILDNALPP